LHGNGGVAREAYHQQYLDEDPAGYCGIDGTGASCPIGVAKADG
jgi:peptide-methionine (S)-S-oxide reductase